MDEVQVLLNGEKLMAAGVVIVAALVLFILVVNAREAWRKIRAPAEDDKKSLQAHQNACETRFVRGEDMMKEHNKRIDRLEDGQCAVCEALRALLEHELHNGNADQMQEASRGLFDHLNKRRDRG